MKTKRLYMAVAIMMLALSAQANYVPNEKYARFLPAFKIDNVWHFTGSLNPDADSKSGGSLQGCNYTSIPGAIAWAMDSWNNNQHITRYNDDHDMWWLALYLVNAKNPRQEIKLCCIYPDAYHGNDDGWWCDSIADYNGNTTRLANEIKRNKIEDGMGVLYFVTFYSDSVRSLIQSAGDSLKVRIVTVWDDDEYNTYAEESFVNPEDRVLQSYPTAPDPQDVAWTAVNNNSQTCVSFYHNLDTLACRKLYVRDSIQDTMLTLIKNYPAFYHPTKLSECATKLNTPDIFHLQTYCTQTHYFRTDFYNNSRGGTCTFGSVNSSTVKSPLVPLIPPVFAQPYEASVEDNQNGSNTVQWHCATPPDSTVAYDASDFVVERATSPDFRQDYHTDKVSYRRNDVNYSFTDEHSVRGLGNQTFYYRISRENACSTELNTLHKDTFNTNYATLENFEAYIDSAAHRVNVKWAYNSGIRNGELMLHINFNNRQLEIPSTGTTCKYDGIQIAECVQTQFDAELYANEKIYQQAQPSFVTMPHETPGVIDTMMASAGFYNDHVNVKWKIDEDYPFFSNFVISRTEYNSTYPLEETLTTVAYTPGVYDYTYVDNTCMPGVYYEYKVTGLAECDDSIMSMMEKKTIGFAQPYGAVSGQITFDGNQAVPGVKVVAECESQYGGKSLHLNANYKPTIEMPASIVNQIATSPTGTIEFFLKVDNSQARYPLMHFGDIMSLECENNSLIFKAGSATEDSVPDALVPGAFTHVAMAFSTEGNQRTVMLYKNGDMIDSITVTLANQTGEFNDVMRFGSDGNGNYMTGNLDEIRIWNTQRTAEEIELYRSIYLNGTEQGLAAYYRCDDNVGRMLFDLSKTGSTFNCRHIPMDNVVIDDIHIPTPDQLGHTAYTDANGNYLFNNIPFSEQGSLYNIVPMYGIHEFEPSLTPLYFNNNANNHNRIDFTDISSFPVSGKVTYYNTNFPVAGCMFLIDGISLCTDEDGETVESDENGEYEIYVPIGKHSITAVKGTHVFANNGRYPADPYNTGTKFDFQHEMTNLTFQDSTFMLVTGRVSGGLDEADKAHGFGLGKAVIGQAEIVLGTPGDLYNLNLDTVERIFTMPQDSIYGTCNSVAKTGPASKNEAHNITIRTDSLTGEFNVMLPPLDYEVRSIELLNNNDHIAFNLSSIGNINLSEKQTYQVTTDSAIVDYGEYSYFSYSDALDVLHYAKPVMTVRQNTLNLALGASDYVYYDGVTGVTDTIPLYEIGENDSITYRFGYPCFTSGEQNTWLISVNERYVNYDNQADPDTTLQPFRYGVVTVSNSFGTQMKNDVSLTDTSVFYSKTLAVTVSGDELLLDYDGNTYYSFQVGEPNILAPYTSYFSVYYEDPARSRHYDWDGNEANEVIVLGSKVIGNSFETKGPDEIFYILRDPVGSESYAEWEKGETITRETSTTIDFSRNISYCPGHTIRTDAYNIKLFETLNAKNPNSKVTVSSTDGGVKWSLHTELAGETYWVSTQNWEFTNLETVTTSADPMMVGSKADIYIGAGTNILYGDAEQVYVKRDTMGNYSIDVQPVISVETEFTTQFNYSQKHIEENLIPDMETHRNQLLTQVTASQYDTSFVNNTNAPLYITTLASADPDYGKDSTYLMIIPEGWKNDTTRFAVDEVSNYNTQIQSWVDAMAHNEHCKAIVHNSDKQFNRTLWEETVYGEPKFPFASVYAPSVDSTYSLLESLVAKYKGGWLDKNYSLSGASLSVNETREYSTLSNGWTHTEGGTGGIGIMKCDGFRFNISYYNIDMEASVDWIYESGTTHTESSSVTYNIEMGTYDALTVDVYQSPDGFGPIFAARGGQTSCPYQDAEYTKYYEPGTEIQAATIPVADPRITVQNPIVNNVPVGESAFFNIQVANVSTVTNAFSSFVLAQEVGSNPDGALILLNGHELSQDGTGFNMYGGDVINKTIEVAQTRYDILDYDSIALVFYTDCYMFDADTVYISAHFVETCADISLSTDYSILNNTTDETVEFTIEDFNQQFRNLNGVELQYKRMGDTEWHKLKEFPADSAAVINYDFTFTKPSFPDGTYLFKAVTKCQYGNEFVTNESLPVSVVVDMSAPEPLGKPYPLDGFYTISSQVYVEFNEPIQTGRVLSDNVQVEGVLNAHDIDHSISLLLDNSTAMTNASYNLGTTPFTLEMWLNYSQPGTLFSYANGANTGIEFGIDATDHLTAKVNGTDYTSTGVLSPDTWGYLVVQCDAVNGSLSATYSYENQNVTLFYPTGIGQAAASGNIRFGGNNLVAKIHEVSLWKELRSTADALAERSESKNSYTQGLISLWHADEGEGFTAVDDVRQRNLTLSADNWAYNHVNHAMKVAAGDTAVVNLARTPLNTANNFVMEFWFRANGDAALCSFPEHGYEMSIVNGSLVMDGYTMPISNYLDDTWHHLALIKPKNATPVVAIDGKQLGSARITALPAFTVSKVSFGSLGNTNDIQIDEFRLWKMNSTLDAVRLMSGTCLDGDEDGLVAYYPMEEYVTDPITSQTSTEFSLYDRTDEEHTRAISHTDLNNAQAASAPALVESRPTEYVAHTYTTSSNKIMVNITEDPYRIEGCELEITVKDIVDQYGNYSDPIRWTVFVNRNQLLWDNDSYEVEKDQDADTTIELTIVNNSSMIQNWEISGVPSCMTLSQTSGTINPLQRLTIDCTIDATADLGENEYELALSGDEGMESYLYITTEVYANEPDWEINPRLFENSMNIVAYAEINGWVADDEQDMVAAFVDGRLAGVANLELLPAMGRYYIMMTIYQNDTTTKTPRVVTFKYWDASTGKIYDNSQAYQTLNDTTYNPITITYSDNLTIGSIVRPIRIVMGDEIEQAIQLNRGWNWISYNVVPTSPSFSTILSPYIENFDIIKSQTGFGVSDSVSASVRGSIGAMDCSKGYRIRTILPFEMTLSGYATPLTPINFAAQQWTWFGFQPQRALTVNAAMSNINPTVGDIVKSQTQFATWDGYQWVGSLNVMIPGQSYIYNNTGNGNINFTYPDYSADASYQLPMQNTAVASYFDPVEPGKYQGNMSITAVVKHAGEAVSEAEIGIFAGDECRASTTYNDGYYFVTVPGDSTVMLTVKVLYNDSVYTMQDGIQYQNDAVIGTLDDPYVIDLKPKTTAVIVAADDIHGDKVEKIMIDNEVFIIRNGKAYDVLGRPREIKK